MAFRTGMTPILLILWDWDTEAKWDGSSYLMSFPLDQTVSMG